MSGRPERWTITLRDPDGGAEVRVTVRDGMVVTDPPEAAQTGFVAAAVDRIGSSLGRTRARGACAAAPPRDRPSNEESHPFG